MSDIPEFLRSQVVARATDRCEYCQLSQRGQEATFHIDHVQPRNSNGPTLLENLALACVSCSLRKGARETATDSLTGEVVALFNPRAQNWDEHFEWMGPEVHAKSPIGRVTLATLALNRPLIVEIRKEEILRGRHPPG